MKTEELIAIVNLDLQNELKHLQFYLHASVMVSGLHREELRELFSKEAVSELKHCEEFAELVVHLGGVPTTVTNKFQTGMTCPVEILKYAVDMEQEVATTYNMRLSQTEVMSSSMIAYVHLFYEEQLIDSQKASWEMAQMVKMYDHEKGCPK